MNTEQINDFILDFECGELSPEKTIQGFQQIINAGEIENLQREYQYIAHGMIENGLCHYAIC